VLLQMTKGFFMSRLTIPTLANAPEASRPALEGLKQALGTVPNLFAVIGNSPAALNGYMAFTGSLEKGSLSGREIELINLFVSQLNGCAYCVAAHGTLSKRFDLTANDISGARAGVGRSERENALLALAGRITHQAGAQAGGEIERARAAGISDAQIVEVAAHVASKLFTNALGILGQVPVDLPTQPQLPRP
jgi:uncharacterized peroxidase-related enzyme